MKMGRIILAAGLLLLLGSCTSFQYLPVDLASPAKEPLPDNIQSLILVNRAVDQRFTDDPFDSIQLRFYQAQFNLDTVIHDIASTDTLLKSLAILLFESGRFDVVIPEARFLMKDSLNPYSGSLSWEDAERLTREFQTDALLSLDYFTTQIFAEYAKGQGMSPEGDQFYTIYAADMKIRYAAHFRVYDPVNKAVVNNLFITDTLNWYDEGYDLNTLFRRFTPVKKGLMEAGIAAALQLSGKIAPEWILDRRAYFDQGSKVLRETKGMVENHDWELARGIWMEASENSKSGAAKSKYEFNIALANEMLGDLDEAVRWSLKSYKSMYRPVTYRYLEILKQRKNLLNAEDAKQ